MAQKKSVKSSVNTSVKSSRTAKRATKPVAKKASKTTTKLKNRSYFKPFKPVKKVFEDHRQELVDKIASLLIMPTRVALVGILVALAYVLAFHFKTNAAGSNGLVSVNIFQRQSQEAPKAVTAAGPAQNSNQFSTYPTWAQDFSRYGSSSLNQKYWDTNIGWPENGNNEAEYYTNNRANLRISNGALVMEATQQSEPGGLQYASSRVDTNGKLSFLYGRFDVTAEVPGGVGTWPAIWFLPANNKYEDLSPASDTTRFLNGGEIDMVESVGFNPNIVYGIVHTLQTNQNNPNAVGDFSQVTVANNDVQYNKYSFLWSPTSITFEINDVPFFTYTKAAGADYTTWPFDQPFYMIMNLALGGEWGGEDTAQFPGNGIDNSALPKAMNIKSIYYYPYIGQ